MKINLLFVLFLVFCISRSMAQTTPSGRVTSEEHELGPNDFILLEKEPVPLNLNALKGMIGYPPLAKEQEIEGKVVIRVFVSKTGDYVKHIVIKDPHPILTNAVTSKISNLKFSPGIQNGKPINVWVTIPFDFRLLKNIETIDPVPANVKTVYYDLQEALDAPDPMYVRELYLHGKHLSKFPTEVFKFTNLQKLELGDNELTVVPGKLEDLSQLRYLGLSKNKFTALPEFIWSMPRLQAVNATQNPFSKSYQKGLEKAHGDRLIPKNDKGKVVW